MSEMLKAKTKAAEEAIGLDQTSWPRLDGADSKSWQMWCLTAPGVVVHWIREERAP